MELISKEVVRRIIDSGRTREQMLEMVESAVAVDSSTDCISREAAIKVVYDVAHNGILPLSEIRIGLDNLAIGSSGLAVNAGSQKERISM